MVITSSCKKSCKFWSKRSEDERICLTLISPKTLAIQLNRFTTAIVGFGLLFLQTSRPLCDVIHFTNGSVLIVDKAWVDGEQVRYQSSAGTKAFPKSSVKRIEHQEATPGSALPTR